MDDKTLRSVISRISSDGPYVLHDGQVRRKSAPREILKMRKATLMALTGGGYIEIVNSHIKLTQRGYRALDTREDERSRSAGYARRMRDRGCVRKTLWVHPDDVKRFEDFVMTLKGPSE